jgi:hypothetical protein
MIYTLSTHICKMNVHQIRSHKRSFDRMNVHETISFYLNNDKIAQKSINITIMCFKFLIK